MKERIKFGKGSLVILSILISIAVSAQADLTGDRGQFLYPEFTVGVVKMKDGEKVILKLNYNIVTEKLVFMQNDQVFDIVNASEIDTAYIAGDRFIPDGKVFHELIEVGKASFFIQHKGSVKKPPRPAAYGGTSEVSSSTYISNIRMGNDVYRKDNRAEVVIYESSIYWIGKDEEMILVSGKNSLLNTFGDRKSEIREFMKRTKFNSDDPAHIRDLVKYYNGLPR